MRDVDERALVRAAKAGDESAYRDLFERHAGDLQGFVVRRLPPYLRRKVSVADILQETSWAGWRAIDRFDDRGEGAFRAWVLKIAERKTQDVLRHHAAQKRAAHREVGGDARLPSKEYPGQDPTPSQQAMGVELAESIRRGLTALTPKQRLILHMVRVEGASMAEIGRRMGRSPAAVQKAYERAKARLWDVCFGDDGPPDGGDV